MFLTYWFFSYWPSRQAQAEPPSGLPPPPCLPFARRDFFLTGWDFLLLFLFFFPFSGSSCWENKTQDPSGPSSLPGCAFSWQSGSDRAFIQELHYITATCSKSKLPFIHLCCLSPFRIAATAEPQCSLRSESVQRAAFRFLFFYFFFFFSPPLLSGGVGTELCY